MIGRAVGAVHHDFQAFQAQFAREGAFTEFDVTAGGIDDPARFTQFGRFYAGQRFFHFGFNGFFHMVRQLRAINGEEFNAVVVKRVMRSRDYNTGFRTEGTCQIGYRRRRHWPREGSRQPRRGKTGFQCRLKHVT
ncbi:hypothetical protein D3C86_1837920 [compost metagenome]